MGTSSKGEIKISVPRKIIFCLTHGPGYNWAAKLLYHTHINMNSGCRNWKQIMKILKKKPSREGKTFLETTGATNKALEESDCIQNDYFYVEIAPWGSQKTKDRRGENSAPFDRHGVHIPRCPATQGKK